MGFPFEEKTKLLPEEWDFGYVELIDEEWDAGKVKKVVDVEMGLGFLISVKLVTDNPNWRIKIELMSKRRIIPIDASIQDLIDEGEVNPSSGLGLWASSNTSKNIYMAKLSTPYPGFPFKRITISLANESGSKSRIIKFQAVWLVMKP